MITTFRYYRPETMNSDDYYEFKFNFNRDNGEWIAIHAADDYHRKHNGWEDSWPITLVIQKEDGTEIGVFDVERELIPSFSAIKAN